MGNVAGAGTGAGVGVGVCVGVVGGSRGIGIEGRSMVGDGT